MPSFGLDAPGYVRNFRKAEIPPLVELWRLCVRPECVHRGADENLDVDTHSDSGESDPLSHTSSRLPVGSIGASVSDIATTLGER